MSRFYMLLYYLLSLGIASGPKSNENPCLRGLPLLERYYLNSTNLSSPPKHPANVHPLAHQPYQTHTPAPVSRSATYRPPPGAPPPQAQQGVYAGFTNPAAYGAPPGADPQLWQWFRAVDEDRSGSISCQELQRALVNGNWARAFHAL
jgi:hypothetical protein